MLRDLSLTLAVWTAGLFAGTCLYVAAVAMPVRSREAPDVALRNFLASLARSERMQPALHGVSLAATIATALVSAPGSVHVALAILAPILPISLGLAVPVYKRIRTAGLPADDPGLQALMTRFRRLHEIRTVLAVIGFAVLAVR